MSDQTKPDWAEWFVDNGARIIIFVMASWFILGMLVPLFIIYFPERYFPKDRLQLAGQFGDMFGSVNSLFTGLAFFAALMTVMMQHLELKESGKRHLEEEKLKVEEMRLAKENLQIQIRMREDIRQDKIQQCLRDANHFATKCLADTPGRNGGYLLIDPSESERAEQHRQSAEASQRHRMSRLELGNAISQVMLLLGSQATEVTNILKQIMIASEAVQPKPSEQQRLLDSLWIEIEAVWKKVQDASIHSTATMPIN